MKPMKEKMYMEDERKFNFRPTLVATTALLVLVFLVRLSMAASFDTLSFKPASDHGYYLTVEQSQTLKKGGFAIGVTGELSNDSFVLENGAGVALQDVIQKQVGLNLGASLGLLDWLNVGVNVSGIPYQEFITPGTLVQDNGGRMGEVTVNFKTRLLDNEVTPIGLAVVPFVTIPTGDDNHFVGNGNVTGGGLLVADTTRINGRLSVALNAGAQFREAAVISPGTVVNDQFLYGAAANLEIIRPVELIAEVDGWTGFNDFFGPNSRNMEINGGIRFFPGVNKRLAVTAGGGTGLMNGVGAPDWRAFTTVSYRHPRVEDALPEPVTIPPPPAPVVEEVITTNKIHFAFNKAVIQPQSHSIVQEILDDIKGRSSVEHVRIEGHTDSIGSDEYNETLSQKRADSVREFMINQGYPSDKVTAVGMGEKAPIEDNATKVGRAQNRRVEFHLQTQPGAHIKVKKKAEQSPTFEDGDPGRNRKQDR